MCTSVCVWELGVDGGKKGEREKLCSFNAFLLGGRRCGSWVRSGDDVIVF